MIGNYRLVRQIGAGGMGTVYQAVGPDGGDVALKLLHPALARDPQARRRLLREAAVINRVQSPGIANVIDWEVDSDQPFVVTEYVHGPTIAEDVRQRGPWNREDLADLAQWMAKILTNLHAHNVIHRDIKPSNIMLSKDGPVLIDFGIAQALGDERLTSTGLITGTPGYVAPELIEGAEPSAATDWWAWAAVLVYCATGRAPFGTGSMEATLARVMRGTPDLEGVDDQVAQCLRAALRANPAERAAAGVVSKQLAAAPGEFDAAMLAPPSEATQVLGDRTQVLGDRTQVLGESAAAAAGAAADATRVVPAPPEPTQPLSGQATTVLPSEDDQATTVAPAPGQVAPDPTRVLAPPTDPATGRTSVMPSATPTPPAPTQAMPGAGEAQPYAGAINPNLGLDAAQPGATAVYGAGMAPQPGAVSPQPAAVPPGAGMPAQGDPAALQPPKHQWHQPYHPPRHVLTWFMSLSLALLASSLVLRAGLTVALVLAVAYVALFCCGEVSARLISMRLRAGYAQPGDVSRALVVLPKGLVKGLMALAGVGVICGGGAAGVWWVIQRGIRGPDSPWSLRQSLLFTTQLTIDEQVLLWLVALVAIVIAWALPFSAKARRGYQWLAATALEPLWMRLVITFVALVAAWVMLDAVGVVARITTLLHQVSTSGV
ncbi:MAG: protein kinase [Actinomycetaceae bacterium]|nr:protein kinase [Actinomycetaceae bacterium]MDU0970419.1 protein kinase [Actinomycetaceae bacterium]